MREMKTEFALAATLRLSQPEIDPSGVASVGIARAVPKMGCGQQTWYRYGYLRHRGCLPLQAVAHML
jgi:hypothetical protein